VVAFVGAGGKTSALFAAAAAAAAATGNARIIATTTTKIRDPRTESGRRFAGILLDPELELPASACKETLDLPSWPDPGEGPLVLASRLLAESGKLQGVHPSRVEAIRRLCDLVLVEADGARGLSVKAPSPDEPVIPGCAQVVVGLVGLDCLSQPLSASIAHRPERLGRLTGCAMGNPIEASHLVALVNSAEGLFKGCPPGALRVLLLNKADAASLGKAEELLGLLAAAAPSGRGPRRIAVCSLLNREILELADLDAALAPADSAQLSEGPGRARG
jgi:probable selenium-dependent hydroxylase accessory protein YqeC